MSYAAAHVKLRRVRGKASAQQCGCGQPASEWSYNGNDGFSMDVDKYEARCRPCHRKLDGWVEKVATRFGEENTMNKLTEEQVRQIREKYVPRKYTMKMLGEEYGMSITQIHSIVHRLNWSGVA